MNTYFRLFLLCLFALAPLLSAADRPNILVILTDDMGYSDLGCYGGEIATPNLDSLAQGGLRYTSMYNTSKCWTTRISLLTGLYHQRSERDFRNTALIGEVLRPAGYRTLWSGKHHADFNPYERGFDHFSGFLGGAINFWNPGGKNAREGEPEPGWAADYWWAFDDKKVKPYVPDKSFYATDTFTDWALEWLDEERPAEEPFFLYMAYNAPHWPLQAHPEDIAKYEGYYTDGYEAMRQARYARQIEMGLYDPKTAPLSPPDHVDWDALTDQERAEEALLMQIHAAMVDRVDQNVGRLIDKLKVMGEFENTLILFLVDNGASHEKRKPKPPNDEPWGSVGSYESIGQSWANAANTPLRKWKVTSMEGGINTPMIAHWPQGISAESGSICREACHLVDLMPTFMELAGDGAEYPSKLHPLDGISLLPTLTGKPLERQDPLYFEYRGWRAIRDGEWKLVRLNDTPWQLYNLESDRTETTDLAAQHPERVEQMAQAWDSWYLDCRGKAWSPGK